MIQSGYPGKITKAVIPAAGKGTRLLPLTKAIPKELIPLGDKPVLDHILEECAHCGITDVLFVISREKTAIRTHFGGSAYGVRCEYAFQDEQKGLADAIRCGREFVDNEPFAVVLGDSPVDTGQSIHPFQRVLDTYQDTNARSVILVEDTPVEELFRFGIVKPKYGIAPSFEIDALVEKPKPEDAPSRYSIAGRYAFDPIVFDYIDRTPPGAGGEYQITDSIALMLRDGHEAWCVALGDGEIRRDIGTFESYFEAFEVAVARLREKRR